MQRSLEDCQLLISSAALASRGWLAPESGESQVEIKGRCCRQVKFGRWSELQKCSQRLCLCEFREWVLGSVLCASLWRLTEPGAYELWTSIRISVILSTVDVCLSLGISRTRSVEVVDLNQDYCDVIYLSGEYPFTFCQSELIRGVELLS